MIIKCPDCNKFFDDQFRNTDCPHDTFRANDGQNNFKHYPESWLNDHAPRIGFSDLMFQYGHHSEYEKYRQWLEKNKIKVKFNEC